MISNASLLSASAPCSSAESGSSDSPRARKYCHRSIPCLKTAPTSKSDKAARFSSSRAIMRKPSPKGRPVPRSMASIGWNDVHGWLDACLHGCLRAIYAGKPWRRFDFHRNPMSLSHFSEGRIRRFLVNRFRLGVFCSKWADDTLNPSVMRLRRQPAFGKRGQKTSLRPVLLTRSALPRSPGGGVPPCSHPSPVLRQGPRPTPRSGAGPRCSRCAR